MSIIRWRNPEKNTPGMVSLQDEMNRLFEDFFTDPWAGRRGLREWAPALGVSEDPEHVTVTAELPGIDGKDLEISVEDNILTLKGEKREETKRDDENHHYVERRYGSFMRRVQLPTKVDPDRADAAMNKGVLTLKRPKLTGDGNKKINVKNDD